MARRNKHDAQIDPFNAGEPIMPHDSFSGMSDDGGHVVEDCSFGEGPYDGPTKEPDNYQAPDADLPQDPRDDRLTPRKRKRAARAKAKIERRAAKAAPQDVKPARKHRCSIIGAIIILVAAVNIVPILLDVASGILHDIQVTFAMFEPEPENDSMLSESHGSDNADALAEMEIAQEEKKEGERECIAMVDEHLRTVTTSDETRDTLAKALDEDCRHAIGGTCDQLGIDANAWADWEMSHLTYEIDSCFIDPAAGTGTVYVNYTSAGGVLALQDIYDEIAEYLVTIDALDDEWELRALTDAEKKKVNKIFTDGLENIPVEQELFFGTDLIRKSDAWSIDMESMSETMDMVLGIW